MLKSGNFPFFASNLKNFQILKRCQRHARHLVTEMARRLSGVEKSLRKTAKDISVDPMALSLAAIVLDLSINGDLRDAARDGGERGEAGARENLTR
jgi:hypothetical protein